MKLWFVTLVSNLPDFQPTPKHIETWESRNDPLAKKYPLQPITIHLKRRQLSKMETIPWLREVQTQAVPISSEDATIHIIMEEGEILWEGREQIVAVNSANLKDAITVHHGHMPEIEMTSDTTACGILAMYDYVQFTNGTPKDCNGAL